jgi:hypothetical protein
MPTTIRSRAQQRWRTIHLCHPGSNSIRITRLLGDLSDLLNQLAFCRGQFDFKVTATDGATSVSTNFSLVLGIDGQPLYKLTNPREALVSIYDAQAPSGAGPVDVWVGLAVPAAQTMTMSVVTQNGTGTNQNTHYTGKTEWVVFHPGEQYKKSHHSDVAGSDRHTDRES